MRERGQGARPKVAERSGKYHDEHGLNLRVVLSERKQWISKSWVQRLVIHGRRRDLGLGAYPLLGLTSGPRMALRSPGVDCACPQRRTGQLRAHGAGPRHRTALSSRSACSSSDRSGRLAHSNNQRYSAPDAADVMLVGNLVVDGEWKSMFTNGMEDWHFDQIYKRRPNTGTLLYAVEVPPIGGDTLFAGMTSACDALDEATRARIAPLEAIYTFEQLDATLRAQDPTRAPLTPEVIAVHPPATHPRVRVHPESGRKSLCISPEVMSHIVGMDREASLALARSPARHALAERFVYRHRWRAGDLVMWDNRCTMHTATVFDATRYRRLLYRTIIA